MGLIQWDVLASGHMGSTYTGAVDSVVNPAEDPMCMSDCFMDRLFLCDIDGDCFCEKLRIGSERFALCCHH